MKKYDRTNVLLMLVLSMTMGTCAERPADEEITESKTASDTDTDSVVDSDTDTDSDTDLDKDSDNNNYSHFRSDADSDTISDPDNDTDIDSDTANGDIPNNSSEDSDNSSLVGITFISVSVVQNGSPFSLMTDTRLSLTFTRKGRFSAGGACNGMSGSYKIQGGLLLVSNMGKTLIGCDSKRSAQEVWYTNFLQSSPSISFDGDTLILRSKSADGDVSEITFLKKEVATPDLPLWDTTWIITSIKVGTIDFAMKWKSPATIEFSIDGDLRFYTGCNQGSATYVVDGAKLILSDTNWQEQGCPDQASQILETTVLSVLGGNKPIIWDIDVKHLTLDVTDAGLRFNAE